MRPPQTSFLDAFSALGDALADTSDTVLNVPIELVDEDPENPRRDFDDSELAGLAATVKKKGLLQPITLRPAGADGRYRLRFGARRLRAAKIAGLREIRAIVRADDDDASEALMEQLIENDQRTDLSTAELAGAVERLLGLGLKQVEIGQRLGRPKEQIAMLSSIREMPAELQALAPHLGLRTLYELFGAWKRDQDHTKAWLAGREPHTITQAGARELAGRPVQPRQGIRNPADGSVREVVIPAPPAIARPKPDLDARSPKSAAPKSLPVHVEVEAGGTKGVLVLEGIERPTQRVRIRLADGAIITAAASEVRILRLRPG